MDCNLWNNRAQRRWSFIRWNAVNSTQGSLCFIATATTARTQSVDAQKTNSFSERPVPLERGIRKRLNLHTFYKKKWHVSLECLSHGQDALEPGGEWHLLKDKLGFQFWKVSLFCFSLSGFCHDAEKYSNEMYWFWDGVIAHLSFASCLFLALLLPSQRWQ